MSASDRGGANVVEAVAESSKVLGDCCRVSLSSDRFKETHTRVGGLGLASSGPVSASGSILVELIGPGSAGARATAAYKMLVCVNFHCLSEQLTSSTRPALWEEAQ